MSSVAWVGYIDYDNDKYYRNKLVCSKLVPKVRIDDCIDLLNGRDFLEETIQYDIVVICYIFFMRSMQDQRQLTKRLTHGKWRVSNLSTPDNWRNRLIKSQANKIIAIGNESEIAAKYLEVIPGYIKKDYKFCKTAIKTRCNNFCVYEKL